MTEAEFYANSAPCPECGHATNAHDGPRGECLADVMHGTDPDTCGCVHDFGVQITEQE